MGADDREIHIEKFGPMSIYCELAVRTIEEPDYDGVSIETTFDHDGLYVTFRDKYGSSRSVRLVLAPDARPSDAQDAPRESRSEANLPATLGNWNFADNRDYVQSAGWGPIRAVWVRGAASL